MFFVHFLPELLLAKFLIYGIRAIGRGRV